MDGSGRETLDVSGNLYDPGSQLAKVNVYGPNGANDIQSYEGLTISSDNTKYAMIKTNDSKNPYYKGNYDRRGKSGALKSNWAINGRGNVPIEQKINPFKPNQIDAMGNAFANGLFIHRSNKNGWSGGGVSKGCPIIAPGIGGKASDWIRFNNQLGGSVNKYNIKMFSLKIIR